MSDIWNKKYFILAGAFFCIIALIMIGTSGGFTVLLISIILYYPASGAFVSISQTVLMDKMPGHREKNMAKWALAGSLGMVIGPSLYSISVFLKIEWRYLFFFSALLILGLFAFLFFIPNLNRSKIRNHFFREISENIQSAIKNKKAYRWFVLLIFSDLMLDIFLAFLALYLVEANRISFVQAGIAVLIWSGVGLAGDFLLIPLLEKVNGIKYLKISSLIVLILFPLFLIFPYYEGKLIFLALLGFFNSGWYSILIAQLYKSFGEKSGTALAAYNISGLFQAQFPWIIGFCADRFGIEKAVWILLLGPIALISGLLTYKEK